MKKIKLLFFINFVAILAFAQNEDASWIAGYYGNANPDDSLAEFFIFSMKLNKDNNPRVFKRYKYTKATINLANSSICDKNGDMMIFFNGEDVFNRNMEPMAGSDSLNYEPKNEPEYQTNYHQSSLILPYPNHKNEYVLIYQERGPFNLVIDSITYEVSGAIRTNYCIIDMTKENSLGKVILRKQNINADTLLKGRLGAVRHANGRDWWIISQKYSSNKFYKFLLDEKGVRLNDIQTVGNDDVGALGQTAFSPDGNYFMTFDVGGYAVQSELFEFDRCTGQLSNPRAINFPNYRPVGGTAFSPNSRFLYINRTDTLYQFDLKAPDLWKSRQIVGVYDGFKFTFNYTQMFLMQLGHDGKIYISIPGGVPLMHVINNPNMLGKDCQFEQRGLKLPAFNHWNVPNYPNFSLGALKGSPCDTLNTIATNDLKKAEIKIFPNPTNENLNIIFPEGENYLLLIKDLMGRVLRKENISNGTAVIATENLPNGLIICELWNKKECVRQEKIVLIH